MISECHRSLSYEESNMKSSLHSSPVSSSMTGLSCGSCQKKLKAPYIECDECPQVLRILHSKIKTTPVFICLFCFSKGKEFDSHKNSHNYVVIRDNFKLLESNWQALEELLFLDGLKFCGVGNWEAVSKQLNARKSAIECKEHFNEVFPTFRSSQKQKYEPISFIDGLEEPPRPCLKGHDYYALAGYNAARSEFEVEHDNDAELLLADIEICVKYDKCDQDYQLFEDLIYAVAKCYQNRNKDRYMRKKTIRQHGLIAQNKSIIQFNRAFAHLPSLLVKFFYKMHQLLNFQQLSGLIESFIVEAELKEQLKMLKLYRHNGLTLLSGATVFEELQESHNIHHKKKEAVVMSGETKGEGETCQSFKVIDSLSKRHSVPLNIMGRAGYESLDAAEKVIAAEIRLLPIDFTKFKNLLIQDCKKNSGLTLAQARLLLKIDVNKTRRIYDFLLNSNLVYNKM